jgi:metallo-beta-lactamase family protein
MRIQFHGAAHTTTGSRHLLEVNGRHLLLDCGLFQGRRKKSYELNMNFPFNPATIDAVLLSHAHIDHCGNLPNLVRKGFDGPIFCTSATQDLSSALLRDSAHIQEKDIQYLNKKRIKKNKKPLKPLYTMEDADRCMYHFHGVYYKRAFQVLDNVHVRFLDAGHILGSALTVIDIDTDSAKKPHRILFTGDLGRNNMPILKDPEFVDGVNTLIIESTYGNRLHRDIKNADDLLEKTINRIYNRNGKIIVPSFSVGRTQELIYSLNRLVNENRIPPIPVFVDSPLSVNVTEVFRHHYECYDSETRDLFLKGDDPFGFKRLKYIRKVEESKELNLFKDQCIIISASGMCEAGRILHHLKNNIENPANLVLVVGFMAANTLGRKIAEKEPRVKIFGETYSLNTEVMIMNEFSAHADADDLENYARKIMETGDLKQIFIVHGEEEQSMGLAARIRHFFKGRIIVPGPGDDFEIN